MDTAHARPACSTGRNASWLLDDSNDQLDQLSEKHTPSATRLLNDELIRAESTRDYFEQHSVFDHEAPFEEIFGPYDGHEPAKKSLQVQTTIKEEMKRFMPTVHNDAGPWERFLMMDPVNEPCYLYGKQQLSMQGLQLGFEPSATIRVLASVAVAAQHSRGKP